MFTQLYNFPFHNYPYYRKDKIKYYFGKIACFGMKVIGVDFYSRCLWQQPYLTTQQINKINVKELQNLVNLSENKRKWHLKGMMTNLIFIIPGIYGLYKLKGISYKYAFWALISAGTLIINNFYGILAHSYNNIYYNRKIDIINYHILIETTLKMTIKEFESTYLNHNQKIINIEQSIFDNVNKNKITWILLQYKNADDCSVYVVSNGYYEYLYFIFDVKNTADEFIIELNKLTIDEIDSLSNNLNKAEEIKSEFIRNRIYNIVTSYNMISR